MNMEYSHDPLDQLRAWLETDVVALATATAGGAPSVRMVLLKGADDEASSSTRATRAGRARELAENPRAAMLVHARAPDPGRGRRREGLGRGVRRVLGDAPRGGQIAASVSRQSEPIGSRESSRSGSPSSTHIRARSRALRTGAATASCPTRTSSGSTGRTACTTASATGGKATARSGNGCSRDYRSGVILGHLDLDAFFAAVEELESPSCVRSRSSSAAIRGRGVVATANYEARKFGIHSAMSCAEALRRCPHAIFVRPRHVYREYSAAVWNAVREVVPTVERTGLDEGYLDLGEVVADFSQARARRGGADLRARGDEPQRRDRSRPRRSSPRSRATAASQAG